MFYIKKKPQMHLFSIFVKRSRALSSPAFGSARVVELEAVVGQISLANEKNSMNLVPMTLEDP